jgi:hypothetical protein
VYVALPVEHFLICIFFSWGAILGESLDKESLHFVCARPDQERVLERQEGKHGAICNLQTKGFKTLSSSFPSAVQVTLRSCQADLRPEWLHIEMKFGNHVSCTQYFFALLL